MRRLLTIAVLGLAVSGATAATNTADAHAAGYWSGRYCAGHTSGWTQAGYYVHLRRYRAYGRMNCASVRYAAKHLRRRMTRTWYGSPNVRFWDGYVTWRCGAFDGGGISCSEYTTGTRFTVYGRTF